MSVKNVGKNTKMAADNTDIRAVSMRRDHAYTHTGTSANSSCRTTLKTKTPPTPR